MNCNDFPSVIAERCLCRSMGWPGRQNHQNVAAAPLFPEANIVTKLPFLKLTSQAEESPSISDLYGCRTPAIQCMPNQCRTSAEVHRLAPNNAGAIRERYACALDVTLDMPALRCACCVGPIFKFGPEHGRPGPLLSVGVNKVGRHDCSTSSVAKHTKTIRKPSGNV